MTKVTPPASLHSLSPSVLAFVDELAKLYADLWAAGRLDEIRTEDVEPDQ